MCKINHFQIFLLIAIGMAVLSVFSQKKGLGPLGVKDIAFVQNVHQVHEKKGC